MRDELNGKRKPTQQEAEELAQMHLRRIYAEHEQFYRGHCISLTDDFRLARDYALHYERGLEGIVLEFGIEEIHPTWLKASAIFVPGRLELGGLKAIHFTPQAWKEDSYFELTQLIDKYKVDYHKLYQ